MAMYELTDTEILLLDGKVNKEVQDKIDFIKRAKFHSENPVIAKIIENSLQLGTFKADRESIRYCGLCKSGYKYEKHTRNGKYHKKGDFNLKKPIYINGWKINRGFISIANMGDFCDECNKKDNIISSVKFIILEKNLPIELLRDKDTKFKKDDKRICFNCKEPMFESEMSQSPTMMGNGYYPAGCPKCKAESVFFGPSHKTTDEFRMRPI